MHEQDANLRRTTSCVRLHGSVDQCRARARQWRTIDPSWWRLSHAPLHAPPPIPPQQPPVPATPHPPISRAIDGEGSAEFVALVTVAFISCRILLHFFSFFFLLLKVRHKQSVSSLMTRAGNPVLRFIWCDRSSVWAWHHHSVCWRARRPFYWSGV